MSEDPVLVLRPAPGVAEVRLNRPDKLNALTPEVFRSLADIGGLLASEADLRAVVLCGAGRAFCAGLDLSAFEGAGDSITGGALAARTHGLANLYQTAAWTWRTLPVPVIAAVSGVAYGGGLQIALGADIRIARADARLSVMEVNWGLVPDMAGVVLMQKLVREDVLRDLCFTGRVIAAEEAKDLGLVTALSDDPHAAAIEKAQEIARKSSCRRAGGKAAPQSRVGRAAQRAFCSRSRTNKRPCWEASNSGRLCGRGSTTGRRLTRRAEADKKGRMRMAEAYIVAATRTAGGRARARLRLASGRPCAAWCSTSWSSAPACRPGADRGRDHGLRHARSASRRQRRAQRGAGLEAAGERAGHQLVDRQCGSSQQALHFAAAGRDVAARWTW